MIKGNRFDGFSISAGLPNCASAYGYPQTSEDARQGPFRSAISVD